jgi:hypothetical protein
MNGYHLVKYRYSFYKIPGEWVYEFVPEEQLGEDGHCSNAWVEKRTWFTKKVPGFTGFECCISDDPPPAEIVESQIQAWKAKILSYEVILSCWQGLKEKQSVVTAEDPPLELGQVVMTRGVDDAFPRVELRPYLERHRNHDWGSISKHDHAVNQEALKTGERVMSVYDVMGKTIWIITEADRSITTILLPSEY